MQRRQFIQTPLLQAALGLTSGFVLPTAHAASSLQDRVLILIELKGGNDSLNTVIPYANPLYRNFRTSLAVPDADILKIDSQQGLHPALAALTPTWKKNELAIVQGLGYPHPNLSHFRSIDIWNTASQSTEYLDEGWITRALSTNKSSIYTAEGVLIGMNEQGPLARSHAISLRDPQAFVAQSRLALPSAFTGNAALRHILSVESNIADAAEGLSGSKYNFTTQFPSGAFGNSVQTAAQIVANQRGKNGIPVLCLSLGSFDTHINQLGTHSALLKQLGEGLAALRTALLEIGAWDRSLVMTYSEFGRRARQNQNNGTDHGTAASHFVMGGAVRGGLIGQAPDLAKLDASQNLTFTTDFRQLFGTVASQWWGLPATQVANQVVRGGYAALPLLRS